MSFDLKEAPEWLRSLASANEEKRRKANEARRAELVKKREALRADYRAGLPNLRKAVDDATAAEELARHAHEKSRAQLAEVRSAEFGASAAFTHYDGRIAAELRELADPRIAAAIDELVHLHELERHKRPESQREQTGEETLSGKKVFNLMSNAESLRARLEAMVQAARQLEKLQEQSVPNVETAIAEILATVPGDAPMAMVLERVIVRDSGLLSPVKA
jgi:hypothetical protein